MLVDTPSAKFATLLDGEQTTPCEDKDSLQTYRYGLKQNVWDVSRMVLGRAREDCRREHNCLSAGCHAQLQREKARSMHLLTHSSSLHNAS